MMLVTIFEIIYAFGVLFIACELGQRMNLAFSDCINIIDQFKWYSFPTEVQRILPIIINFAQQPHEVKCVGSASCDRETLKFVSFI